MSDNLNLGKIITTAAKRDAIHVAIIPVLANEELYPGQHVGLISKGIVVGTSSDAIGIVYPFLTTNVAKGQICWLFLYPNTVTSLRHAWTHPAFTDEQTAVICQKEVTSDWRTATVIAICREMRESSNHRESFPILCDALEDAGYEDLANLRSCYYHSPEVLRVICLALGGKLSDSVRWIEEFAKKIDQTYNRLMLAALDYVEGESTYDNTQKYEEGWKEFPQFWQHYAIVVNSNEISTGIPFMCSC